MRIYTVYLRRRADPLFTPDRDAVFVRDGFDAAAFLLTFVWALASRLWLAAALLLAANAALLAAAYGAGLDALGIAVVQAAWHFLAGLSAADLVGWSLRRRGYAETGVVAASTSIAAERRYFEHQAYALGARA
jgi:hypothetical protein